MEIENTKIIVDKNYKKIYIKNGKIFKFFNSNYSNSDVLNEALNQSRAIDIGLNVPKILDIILNDKEKSIVMEYIEGDTLEDLMNKNPEKTDEYLDLFIKIQQDVHSHRQYLFTKYNDKLIRKIMMSNLDASTRYDLAIRMQDMPNEYSICHGDFHPSNVVIDKNGKAYILDWSHASQGNPLSDVAKSYIQLCITNHVDFAEKYVEKFAKILSIDVKDIKKWLPFIASAQLIKAKDDKKYQYLKWIYDEELNG